MRFGKTQFAVLATLLLATAAHAQDVVRIGICNPGKVWEGMDERKAIQDKVVAEREKLKVEAARKKAEVEELQRQRNDLKPGSAQFEEKTRLMLEKAVEFEVWAKMKEAEVARQEKENIRALFDKIAEAAKQVAESRKLDVVFAERRPELANWDSLTPDQVRAVLSQRDVLYINEKADITEAVRLLINKQYAQQAAGTGAPAK